ncbi:MAG: TFIIB-type zinc ribbon-containing protein [Candidatus Thermoplasmatota archaeon]|jgi:hypothetical protein|nr:TFIIB-type zinc ribbon-containing protein [Candidatus Thermoplasmatota archaeon]
MAIDLFVILYEVMAMSIFLLLLVLFVLIPSRKRVREGRAGSTMRSPLVPILLFSSLTISVLTVPLAVLLVKDALILALTSLFIIPASVLAFWDYNATRRLFEEVKAGTTVGPSASQVHEVDELPMDTATITAQNPPTPSGASRADHMTVECPRCKGRIEVHPRQATLTCPYCGLTGSL